MKPNLPNVAWIMSDQHAARFSGCYGHQTVKTPCIDDFARRAALFGQAYTTCPMCIPARFAMLTGKYGNRTGTTAIQPLSHREKTAAHLFREAGYATAMIGKLHPGAPQPLGFDYYVDFPHYFEYLGPKSEIYIRNMGGYDTGCGYPYVHSWYQEKNDALRLYLEESRSCPADAKLAEADHFERFVAGNAQTFIEQSARAGEPFFLFASFLKPHFPHDAPERFRELYRPSEMVLPDDIFEAETLPPSVASGAADTKKSASDLTFEDFRFGRCPDLRTEEGQDAAKKRMAGYFSAITFMDSCFGQIIDSLKQNGVYGNTLVVYTSDHGEMLFSHGLVQKFVFYDQSVRIPMLVKLPGQDRGTKTNGLADLADLLPTTLSACGLPLPAGMDGIDQSPALAETGETGKSAVYSELGENRMMMFEGRYKLCLYEDGEMLFDMEEDPGEKNNLRGNASYAKIYQNMRSSLNQWKEKAKK